MSCLEGLLPAHGEGTINTNISTKGDSVSGHLVGESTRGLGETPGVWCSIGTVQTRGHVEWPQAGEAGARGPLALVRGLFLLNEAWPRSKVTVLEWTRETGRWQSSPVPWDAV